MILHQSYDVHTISNDSHLTNRAPESQNIYIIYTGLHRASKKSDSNLNLSVSRAQVSYAIMHLIHEHSSSS